MLYVLVEILTELNSALKLFFFANMFPEHFSHLLNYTCINWIILTADYKNDQHVLVA